VTLLHHAKSFTYALFHILDPDLRKRSAHWSMTSQFLSLSVYSTLLLFIHSHACGCIYVVFD
jgi:drug/metabolite transporter superfamily protein YnfA